MQDRLQTGTSTAVIANGLVVALIAFAALLFEYDADRYYLVVQEDGVLEWATFWAFLIAAGLSAVAAVRQHRVHGTLPWFLTGVGLFCLFVALEEISWGQRVLGYRPPVYFLDQNFQQEFNLHNVVATRWRKLALTATIFGYGVFLPCLQLVPASARLLGRLGVAAPPIGLLPVFVAAGVLYEWYPRSHTGEWVELFLGVGFLVAALAAVRHYRADPAGDGNARVPFGQSLAALGAIAVLAWLTAALSDRQRQAHPGNVAATESELAAMKADFESGRVETRCSLHKRLYTFVLDHGQEGLFEGSFAALQTQGLPEERARFFLDPWNSPYWIRDRCDRESDERITFVYSFGPNRRRDSTRTEILGDDIGTLLSMPAETDESE